MGNSCNRCYCIVESIRYGADGTLKYAHSTSLFRIAQMITFVIPKQWVENGKQFVKNDSGVQKHLQEQLSKLYSHEDEKILGGLKDED